LVPAGIASHVVVLLKGVLAMAAAAAVKVAARRVLRLIGRAIMAAVILGGIHAGRVWCGRLHLGVVVLLSGHSMASRRGSGGAGPRRGIVVAGRRRVGRVNVLVVLVFPLVVVVGDGVGDGIVLLVRMLSLTVV